VDAISVERAAQLAAAAAHLKRAERRAAGARRPERRERAVRRAGDRIFGNAVAGAKKRETVGKARSYASPRPRGCGRRSLARWCGTTWHAPPMRRVLVVLLVAAPACGSTTAGPDASHEDGGRPCDRAVVAAGLACETLGGPLLAPRDVVVARDGTLYVTEMGAGRVVRLDGDAFAPVAQDLAAPIGIRQLDDGALVVGEEGAGSVARIDPASGARTPIADGLRNVTYVALDATGAILVSSFAEVAPTGTGVVWRVDATTGERTVRAEGLHVPEGLFADAGGALVVAEWHEPAAVRRFEAGVGAADASTVVADGFMQIYGLIDDGAGGIFAGDHAGCVVRVRADGTRETILDGIGRPGGLSRAPDGALLVVEFVDFAAPGRLLRVTGLGG
jgi:sugar lactone lactonase YvrE